MLQLIHSAFNKSCVDIKVSKVGRNWVLLRGGRRYIYDRKDEITHGLSPSVKCVAPLLRDMSLAKV